MLCTQLVYVYVRDQIHFKKFFINATEIIFLLTLCIKDADSEYKSQFKRSTSIDLIITYV